MEKRGRWDSRTAFLLAAIGSAVGLGNVWRFPFIAHQNGGGAFLIPFFIAMFTAGIPLLILEFGLGNLMQSGAPQSFAKISKRWEWLGWFALLIAFGIVSYYTVIMGWCFNYLIHSFKLAWGANPTHFFNHIFLERSSGPGILGGIRIPVLLGLLATWACIFLIIVKGARSVGKVVLITVPLPWLCLLILAVRGATLPGALEGLKYYLTPDFGALRNPGVWMAAYSQVFFSFSIGFGVMIAYASYLPKRSDISNNAFITGVADSLTAFIAGLAVFSTLGYLAYSTGVGVQDVAKGGPGLAFCTYPTTIMLLPFGASVFGIIFFIMLLTLGIDSAFSLVESAVAGLQDKWKISRMKANSAICIAALALGIIFTTRGGLHWLDIVDHYLNQFGLAVVGLLMCLVVGYVFKAKKLREYINEISEVRLGKWWDYFISILTPLVLIVLIAWTLIQRIRIPYEGYPQWALFLGGWLVVVIALEAAFLLAGQFRKALYILIISCFVAGLFLLEPWVAMMVVGFVVLLGGLAYSFYKLMKHS